jgi:hypothetical protein
MTDPSPDAFAAVADLIRLIADPDGCAKRIRELQKLGDQLAKAQAKLETERAEHGRKVAADTAELAEREAVVRKREVAVVFAERDVNERAQRFAAELPPRYPHDPNLGPGTRSYSGLTREAE